ncbi:MAG: signal peptide peptidase SppA, partial [Sinomicrobium sp.]|nr:signal peptide peptidase SppA [Sinomicrobium sp.]
MKFLRNLLASVLGSLVAFGIIFFMLLLLIALAGSEEKDITIPRSSVLKITFKEPIKDYGGKYSFTD